MLLSKILRSGNTVTTTKPPAAPAALSAPAVLAAPAALAAPAVLKVAAAPAAPPTTKPPVALRYNANKTVLLGYKGNTVGRKIVIANTVKTIAPFAFRGCSGIVGPLTIPASVSGIGISAFEGCSGLTSLVFPNTGGKPTAPTLGILYFAFEGCSGLKGTLTFPTRMLTMNTSESNNCIFYNAFEGCSGLKTLTISKTSKPGFLNIVQALSVFKNCTGLTTITPEFIKRLVNIPPLAFKGCTGLKSLDLTRAKFSSSESYLIQSFAFLGCKNLTVKVTRGTYGELAFLGCKKVNIVAGPTTTTTTTTTTSTSTSTTTSTTTTTTTSTTPLPPGPIPIENLDIQNGVLLGLKPGSFGSGSLVIPSDGTVTSIGVNAFLGPNGITGSLTIPLDVTRIGDGAFRSCTGLTGTLTIPSTLTFIGEEAFYECGFTGSLTIPQSVTSIGDAAFTGCANLTISYPSTIPILVANSAFAGTAGYSSYTPNT